MKPKSPLIISIAMALAALDGSVTLAADSTSYKPVEVPWQRPSSAGRADTAGTADTAGYATNAGTATAAGMANALCPTCTVAGSQVSGKVGSAGYSDSANYSNSSGYATNAGYAASSAASGGASCPALPAGSTYYPPSGTAFTLWSDVPGVSAAPNAAVAIYGQANWSTPSWGTVTLLCVSGIWAELTYTINYTN